jgi:hypothetical protein
MTERNRCQESGCRGGCCEDITIYDDEEVIRKTFPDAEEVSAWELRNIIDGKDTRQGVYYLYDGRDPEERGMVITRISGPCTNRRENGDCDRHHRCSHAAENFEYGSIECNDARAAHGLPPVER